MGGTGPRVGQVVPVGGGGAGTTSGTGSSHARRLVVPVALPAAAWVGPVVPVVKPVAPWKRSYHGRRRWHRWHRHDSGIGGAGGAGGTADHQF